MEENMQVEVVDGIMTIKIKMLAPRPSSSGKTLIVATSSGLQKTTVKVNGKQVTVGVNAFIDR